MSGAGARRSRSRDPQGSGVDVTGLRRGTPLPLQVRSMEGLCPILDRTLPLLVLHDSRVKDRHFLTSWYLADCLLY